jgi:hypothetical protein
LAYQVLIGDVVRTTSRFTFVVGLMQGAAAIWTTLLAQLFAKIRVYTVKNTKKTDFVKKF